MQIAVYCAVLMIALGSVLLEMDWMSAPMTPMVDTEAGLHATAMPPPAPVQPAPTAVNPATPGATIGAPIVPPGLAAPTRPPPAPSANAPPPPAAPAATDNAQRPQCNVDACTAAYRSFRTDDCTYQPSNGPRRLCTK